MVAAACAGPLALALGCALLWVRPAGVQDAFWPIVPVNVAEAAALHDAGMVRRLMEHGASASARLPVRAGVLGQQSATTSALEAATAIGSTSIVQMLLELGASPSRDELVALHCLARSVPSADISDLLTRTTGVAQPAACPADAGAP